MNADDHEGVQINHTLSKNVIVSILVKVFYLVTRLFLPPFILGYVTLPEYGIWSYCFILISYVGMGVFGITNVYVRYIAVYFAHGELDKINRLVSTGTVTVSAICSAILALAWLLLPRLFPWINVPPDLYSTAFILMFGTIAIQVVDMTVGVYDHILQSIHKMIQEKIIWGLSFILETVCIVLFLKAGFGIYSLLIAYIVRTLAAIVAYSICCYKYLPGLSIGLKHFDKTMIPLFIRFGGVVQLTGIIAVINRSFEKVVAGSFLGIKATALYEVGEKFPVMATSIPEAVNAVLLPTTAHLHAKERSEHICRVYMKSSRFINIVTGLMMGFMTPFAPAIIRCWLGHDEKFAAAATILAFFAPAYQMDVLTGPISAIYRSIEQPLRELVYNLGQFLFVLAGTCVMFYFFGASIMTINIAVASMMIVAAVCYLILANRFLSVSQIEYIKSVLLPGILPYLFGYVLSSATYVWYDTVSDDRRLIFVYLALNLIFYTVITSLFTYMFLVKKDEKDDIKKILGSYFPKKKE